MKRLIFALALLCIPYVTAAENVTTWDLMNQEKIQGWNTNNLTAVQLIPQGLSIITETEGQIVKVSKLTHKVDTIGIQYIAPTGGKGIFFWRAPGMEGADAYQINVEFVASQEPQSLVLDMSQIKEWDYRSDRIGLNIAPGTQILLQKFYFLGPEFMDTIVFPLRSFFVFDRHKAFSINFLWGPQMVYNLDQLSALFSSYPPKGNSWNRVYYAILGFFVLLGFLLKRLKKPWAYMGLLTAFAFLWIVYDLRMGSEFISYAKADYHTWWSKPVELKDYRDRRSFTAYSLVVSAMLEGRERFVFIADQNWPYLGAIRYEAYPSYPVSMDSDTEGIDTWVIYRRPDITLGDDSRLMLEGEAISPPGEIILQFEPGAFLFRTK